VRRAVGIAREDFCQRRRQVGPMDQRVAISEESIARLFDSPLRTPRIKQIYLEQPASQPIDLIPSGTKAQEPIGILFDFRGGLSALRRSSEPVRGCSAKLDPVGFRI
jgi:hypothetical protein